MAREALDDIGDERHQGRSFECQRAGKRQVMFRLSDWKRGTKDGARSELVSEPPSKSLRNRCVSLERHMRTVLLGAPNGDQCNPRQLKCDLNLAPGQLGKFRNGHERSHPLSRRQRA